MTHNLTRLHSGFAVDQALESEQNRVVLVRFGREWDPGCMETDQCLASIQDTVKEACVIALVDLDEAPEYAQQYDLSNDAGSVMFFVCSKAITIDFGQGKQTNKVDWPLRNKQELLQLVETVYRGAQKGRDVVVAGQIY